MLFILLIYISLFKSGFLFPLILVFRSLKVIYLDMLFDIYPALFSELLWSVIWCLPLILENSWPSYFSNISFAQLFYSRVKVMYLLAHLICYTAFGWLVWNWVWFFASPTEANIHLSHGFTPYVYALLGLSSIISVSIWEVQEDNPAGGYIFPLF